MAWVPSIWPAQAYRPDSLLDVIVRFEDQTVTQAARPKPRASRVESYHGCLPRTRPTRSAFAGRWWLQAESLFDRQLLNA